MLVITEISDSLQDFSKCVGMGSRQQEVDQEFAMSTRTSSSANSSKASMRVGGIVESLFTSLSLGHNSDHSGQMPGKVKIHHIF